MVHRPTIACRDMLLLLLYLVRFAMLSCLASPVSERSRLKRNPRLFLLLWFPGTKNVHVYILVRIPLVSGAGGCARGWYIGAAGIRTEQYAC